ncbi:c-type cytochrome [Roseovarius sp. S4756]|uniref:c-type cytochrome n=1 Tax=Roseovarius maritimus TaxID=3342637 RepID=UPI003726E2BE
MSALISVNEAGACPRHIAKNRGWRIVMKTAFRKIAYFIGSAFLANSALAEEDAWGKHFYDQNCATCHGAEGKGNGNLAEWLSIEVPDLTMLSERNGGEFPMLRVIHIVDGRSELRAHENPMPPFGAKFRDEIQPPYGMAGATNVLIRGRVLSIADYLQTIQK